MKFLREWLNRFIIYYIQKEIGKFKLCSDPYVVLVAGLKKYLCEQKKKSKSAWPQTKIARGS